MNDQPKDPDYWVIDWLKQKRFDFVDVDVDVDVGFGIAKDLGVNLVSLGNKKVLSMAGAVKLNEDLRARATKCPHRTCRCLPWAEVGYTACARHSSAIQ